MQRNGTFIALFVALGLSRMVSSQEQAEKPDFGKRWEGRVIVNVNGGLQTLSPSLAYEHFDNFIYAETIGALNVPGAAGRILDVTAGVRLFGNFGVALSYARYEVDQLAELTGTLQFAGEEPLSDQIQVRDFERTEDTVHIQAVYVIPFTPRVQLGVFGGPSHFETRQDVLNDYHFEYYGYWTPDGVFTYYPEPGSIQTDSGSAWGYNLGADLSYFFSRNIGVGFHARYSQASIDYENPIDRHEIDHGFRDEERLQVVPFDMGGLQLMGGVRFRF